MRTQSKNKAQKTTVTVENFIVKTDWRKIHFAINSADLAFLEEQNRAVQAQMGIDTWLAIACEQIEVTPETCEPYATITAPAEIAIAMEKRRLDEIEQTCKDKGVDLMSALRMCCAARCTQIRKFQKRKERKSRLALATA